MIGPDDITIVELAQRIIALAKQNPEEIEARVYPKGLAEVCQLLLDEGITSEISDEALHVRLLRIRVHYPRLYLIQQYPSQKNCEALQRVKFVDGKIVVPSQEHHPVRDFWWW